MVWLRLVRLVQPPQWPLLRPQAQQLRQPQGHSALPGVVLVLQVLQVRHPVVVALPRRSIPALLVVVVRPVQVVVESALVRVARASVLALAAVLPLNRLVPRSEGAPLVALAVAAQFRSQAKAYSKRPNRPGKRRNATWTIPRARPRRPHKGFKAAVVRNQPRKRPNNALATRRRVTAALADIRWPTR